MPDLVDASDPRFADPAAVKELPLGDCRCPGTPHAGGDTAMVRTHLGWGEMRSAWGAGQAYREDGGGYYDEAVGDATAIARFTRAWTLVDLNGRGKSEPRPISVREVLLLDEDRFKVLKDHFDAVVDAKGRLPNGSSGRSPDSSRETASPTRRQRAR